MIERIYFNQIARCKIYVQTERFDYAQVSFGQVAMLNK